MNAKAQNEQRGGEAIQVNRQWPDKARASESSPHSYQENDQTEASFARYYQRSRW
jgi:hypothetical protein